MTNDIMDEDNLAKSQIESNEMPSKSLLETSESKGNSPMREH
jgi:hypothetical protein